METNEQQLQSSLAVVNDMDEGFEEAVQEQPSNNAVSATAGGAYWGNSSKRLLSAWQTPKKSSDLNIMDIPFSPDITGTLGLGEKRLSIGGRSSIESLVTLGEGGEVSKEDSDTTHLDSSVSLDKDTSYGHFSGSLPRMGLSGISSSSIPPTSTVATSSPQIKSSAEGTFLSSPMSDAHFNLPSAVEAEDESILLSSLEPPSSLSASTLIHESVDSTPVAIPNSIPYHADESTTLFGNHVPELNMSRDPSNSSLAGGISLPTAARNSTNPEPPSLVRVADFDPLIPKEWLSKFSVGEDVRNEVNLAPALAVSSFLDSQAEHGQHLAESLRLKYSQEDLDKLEANLRSEFNQEFDMAQMEISELEKKRQQLGSENAVMKSTLLEWETAMKEMLACKDESEKSYVSQIAEKAALLASKEIELLDAKEEFQGIQFKYKTLRVEVEDFKELELKLKASQKSLQDELALINQRYSALKTHAEEKLECANVEIAKVRSVYEKEISTLKARLSRAELQVSSLSKQVESKSSENAELTKICDQLVAQIEQMGQ